MANTVSLTFTPAADGSAVTITDATTYSSPSRATCGVYINVYKTDFSGAQTKLTITLDNADPNFTSTWAFNLDTDGWYQAYYVAPPDYSTLVSYAANAAVFDPTNKLVYKSKSNGNLNNSLANTTYWTVVPDPATLAEYKGTATDSANTDTLITNKVFGFKALELRDRYAVDIAAELCGDSSLNKDINLFELYDLFVSGMEQSETYSEFSQGERIARRAEGLSE